MGLINLVDLERQRINIEDSNCIKEISTKIINLVLTPTATFLFILCVAGRYLRVVLKAYLSVARGIIVWPIICSLFTRSPQIDYI